MQQDDHVTGVLRQVAFSALVAGTLMVLVGFALGLRGVSQSAVYNASVTAFVWLMRVGGIAMLLVAALALAGWARVLALDALLAAAIGAGMALTALIWLASGDLIQGILILVFGGLFVRSATQSWQAFRSLEPLSPPPPPPATPPPAPPPAAPPPTARPSTPAETLSDPSASPPPAETLSDPSAASPPPAETHADVPAISSLLRRLKRGSHVDERVRMPQRGKRGGKRGGKGGKRGHSTF